jgi:arabinofuranosyltransferase
VYPRITRWWRSGDHTGTVVLLAPLLAGAADALYVVHVGGDYMEGRLLLPALLCCCLAVFVDVKQFRTLVAIPVIGLAIWSLVCVSWLRPSNVVPFIHNMHDERATAIADSGERNPIDLNAYPRFVSLGRVLEETAASIPSGHRSMVVLEDPGRVFIVPSTKPQSLAVLEKHWKEFVGLNLSTAHSTLPFRLAINLSSIGEMGYEAGPNVYIFDALSLANPIGSHTTVAVRGVPGHEKVIGQAWMIARFAAPGEEIPNISIFALAQETASARRALDCNPLRSYLAAITKPLTFSQALSNIVHSYTYTTMSFDPDPNNAVRQLCGG